MNAEQLKAIKPDREEAFWAYVKVMEDSTKLSALLGDKQFGIPTKYLSAAEILKVIDHFRPFGIVVHDRQMYLEVSWP